MTGQMGGAPAPPAGAADANVCIFDSLTFLENTELYMIINRGYGKLAKLSGALIGLQAWDAAGTVNAMSGEAVGLLEDLNVAARNVRTIASAGTR